MRREGEETVVSVTGLGYVGLPLALAFSRRFHVIAYDHNAERIAMLGRREDPSYELSAGDFDGCDIRFTNDAQELSEANFHIVAVPTPVDSKHTPDISLLKTAVRTVARGLKVGDTVVVESTVYPGCTEEDCLPILEKESGLSVDRDFGLGYSPERINPGDRQHRLTTVRKIVSGHDERTLGRIAATYGEVISAGVFAASSIKVAEAAKIIENTQRDVNIALMNELSLIFARMGIETTDVIEAASTKWNFMPFRPGLVGGHCIGVDPYYLDYKASELGYHTQVINKGRYVNDSMGRYVAKQAVKLLISGGVVIGEARVLLMGLTYKEDVADVRNTRSVDIIDELRSFSVRHLDVVDPVASRLDAERLYGLRPEAEVSGRYDAVIVAVAHRQFRELGQEFFDEHLEAGGVLVDVHSLYKDKVSGFKTWRL